MEAIRAELSLAPACIVLIGTQWADPGNLNRIEDPADPVRQEIFEMLSRKLRIIPVLVDATLMPAARDLPLEVEGLTRISPLRLRHDSFDRDFSALERVLLNQDLKPADRSSALLTRGLASVTSSSWPIIRRLFFSFSISLSILLCALIVHQELLDQSLDETLSSPQLAMLCILIILSGGTITGLMIQIQWSKGKSTGP